MRCVKLDSLNKYSSDIVHPVDINLDDVYIELMFNKILNLDFSTNRDYVFKETKEMLVKMKRREYKMGVNY